MATRVVVTIVGVESGQPICRSVMVDGTITYEPDDDITPNIIRRYRRWHPEVTEVQAFEKLAVEGWSNGYLMVQLPGLK